MAKIYLLVFMFVSLVSSIARADATHSKYTFIPANAKIYLPLVKNQQEELWPKAPLPYYFGALIEKESCVTLTSKRCWDPRSRLLTSREEGAGFFQLTRAYNSQGKVRFDTLTDLSKKYDNYLKDLSWSNVYSRPDLQINAGILLSKNNYDQLYFIKDPKERMYFSDAAYNQGLGRTLNQSRICGLQEGCNPELWFHNVASVCTNNAVLYGGRTACEINRDHVSDIFQNRIEKYYKIWNCVTPEPLDKIK